MSSSSSESSSASSSSSSDTSDDEDTENPRIETPIVTDNEGDGGNDTRADITSKLENLTSDEDEEDDEEDDIPEEVDPLEIVETLKMLLETIVRITTRQMITLTKIMWEERKPTTVSK